MPSVSQSASEVRNTACILCSRNCGLEVTVDEQSFLKIKGDAKHPDSKGYICQKAARLEHYQNHDDRLTEPLKKMPNGEFKSISWEQALTEIAEKFVAIRDQYGGDAFAAMGGGGQGNHLATAYFGQIVAAMNSRNIYTSLAQEKTGEFWVNGRLFGKQNCHACEGIVESDYVLFIGTNPFQSHGIANARDNIKALRKDPNRTMVVVDPKRTETAKQADIHLQLKPGTDAYLLAAMLSIIIRNDLHDKDFIAERCKNFGQLEQQLLAIPVEEFVERTGLELAQVEQVALGFARARSAVTRVDLGTQHTLHTTLNAYLEKLMYLITGNFGVEGGANLHSHLIPIVGNTDERVVIKDKPLKRTKINNMMPIGGLLPPNILPQEILEGGIKAGICDSANIMLSWPDTPALQKALQALDIFVVVDVAMTETARLADYVLPAASQFEKWEATGFNLEFPDNYFQLRDPLFKPTGNTLAEPEIYTRLLQKMGELPASHSALQAIARYEPSASNHALFLMLFQRALKKNKRWAKFAPSLLYMTLGKSLPNDGAAAAFLLPLCLGFARKHEKQVRRAGFSGGKLGLGVNLFRSILRERSGVVISRHTYDEMWELMGYKDKLVDLGIDEMLEELEALKTEKPLDTQYPFILMAGERRSYNANQIYRKPDWRKIDPHGAMRIHPNDAERLGLAAGDAASCKTETGAIEVVVEVDDSLLPGVVTLPHGYGMRYKNGEPQGPEINLLTAASDCDPLSKTPYHKYIPASVEKVAAVI